MPNFSQIPGSSSRNVLSHTISSVKADIPESYFINLPVRRQAFNLSCEFAAASAIIHYFTNNLSFTPENETYSEEKLFSQINVSKNPNIGIRMGDILEGDFTGLLRNLNEKFGGADYYGVHAPPFIDLFAKYGLLAKPIITDESIVKSIQKAISSNHLVMAWIKIGYNKSLDIALSYGPVSVIRGEHVIVVSGYDEKSFIVMDPGNGQMRSILHSDLLNATEPFSMPFLEIYPSSSKISPEDVYLISADKFNATPREKLRIGVENGSRKVGIGNELTDILKDFGYKVGSLRNADRSDYLDLNIKMKKSVWDYKVLLEKDLKLANFRISGVSGDLSEEKPEDTVIIIGN